ncbi:DUF2490 domain-containing protein [Sandaracinobacteroides sp. A072]|uniref:DUF2490 domain-containing protein n=1 Tax=Sandaracinobacteroides sp. A072 TaxID=3461146 RepID=UPI0040429309
MRLHSLALALLLPLCPGGQAIAGDWGFWGNSQVDGPLGGDWVFSVDSSFRFADDMERHTTSQVRGSVGRKMGGGLTLSAGYLYGQSYRPGRDTVEHRFYQQASYPILGETVRLSGRTRFEQGIFNRGGGLGLRVRQQLKLTAPLADDRGPDFVASGEAFVRLDDAGTVQRSGFDQFRAFAGLKMPVTKVVALEGGYMGIFRDRPARRSDIVQITASAKF